jgi:kumamolisin
MAADERVRVLISFELCDQGGLNQLLADLYDPASPSFHQWLTAKQFGKRFGRSQREIRMATDWLLSQGLSVDLQYTNRLAIAFSGTPDTIERAFNVQMGQYWDSASNRPFYSNLQEPVLPNHIAAFTAGLVGLNNLVTYHRPIHAFEPAKADKAAGQSERPAGITQDGHTFLGPSDLAVVYNYQSLQSAGTRGQGQTVGIIMDSDIKDSDMAAYRTQFGLPAANLQRLVLPGLTNPGLTKDGELEADLDTESVSAVAPLAQIDLIVIPALNSISIETAQQDVLNMGSIRIVNESFGGCEQGSYNGTDQALFSQAMAQGIAFFASAGDSGSVCPGPSGNQGISCPACYGGVTAVGGTQIQATFNTDGSIAQKTSENVWNNPPGIQCQGGHGSATGGGIARLSPMPTYQQGAQGFAGGVPAGNARVVPDVAALAGSPFTLVFNEGQSGLVGGTSLSAPLWAGMMALINQVQGSPQGSPNSVLYQAGINQYKNGGTAVFQDVTSGNNNVLATPCGPAVAGFPAGAGFDAVSGWGVPNLAALVHSFGNGGGGGCTYTLSPAIQSFATSGGTGSFTISASSTCAWTALPSDSWITVTSGTSGSGNGTVSYTVAANTGAGGRNGNISVSGQLFNITQSGTSGGGQTVELAVDAGAFQSAVGNTSGGSQYGVNRLTPASYPATLQQLNIYFPSFSGLQVGQSITLAVGANPSGSSNIDGVTFQTLNTTIQSVGGFTLYNVPNITINSGDFVVGFQITLGAGVYAFADDKVSPHQQRSYVSVDGNTFYVIDNLEPTLAGNFGIRAEVTEGTGGGGGGGGGGVPTLSSVTADLASNVLTISGIAANTGSLQGQLDVTLEDGNGQTVFDTGGVPTNFSSASRSNFLYQISTMASYPTAVSASVVVITGQNTRSSPVSANFGNADSGGPSITRVTFNSGVLQLVGGTFEGSLQLQVNGVQVAPPAKIKIKGGGSKLKIAASDKSLNLNSGPNRIRMIDNGLRSNIFVFSQ